MTKTILTQLLCPFGKFTHWKGMQLIDISAGLYLHEALFTKIFHKLKEIPIYGNGHADNISKDKQWLKQSTVGYVVDIFNSNQGILVKCEYHNITGLELIKRWKYSMSPSWKMQIVKDEEESCGIAYRPIELLSIALTQSPNIAESGRIIDDK